MGMKTIKMLSFAHIWLAVYIIIYPIGLQAETMILSQPRSIEKKEGDPADFTVTLANPEIGSTVTWYKDTIYVNKSDPRITYDEENRDSGQFTVRINPVIRSDKGSYVAAYAFGDISLSTDKASLTVLEIPTAEYPICTMSKPIYDVMDIVTVTCISENTYPEPNLQFVRKASRSEVINNGTNIMICMEFMAHPNLDQQLYSCQQSGPNLDTKYCDVVLNISNMINVTMVGEKLYDFGDTANLTCIGNYSKSGRFHWEIPDNIRNQVKTALNESRLEIQVNMEVNGANVTCIVHDGSFTGSSSVILHVNEYTATTVSPIPQDDLNNDVVSTGTSSAIVCLLSFILIVLFAILANSIIVTVLLYKMYKTIEGKNTPTLCCYRAVDKSPETEEVSL